MPKNKASSQSKKQQAKKASSESDSSDSSSDEDLFHHKAAKSYKQSTWKLSNTPPSQPEPNKKKNLLEMTKTTSPNSKTETKEEGAKPSNNDDLLLELQVDMYKNELHKKNAKRNTVTDEESKKKRKPTDEELKKIILEQKKQRREQKRTKHTHSSSIPPEDIISIDDDLTPTTVENATSTYSTIPTSSTNELYGNTGSAFSSSSSMFVRSPAFSNPFRAISPFPSYSPGDFFYERSKNDLQRKFDTLLQSSSESVFDKLETIDKSATELSEKEKQRLEESLKKQLEELKPELKLDNSTLIDQEEDTENKGEKITIRVRWNEKIVPINMTEKDKFQKLKKTVAKQFDAHPDQVTLIFDGMPLNLKSTPEDHGMETDDIIDCKIDKSKPISTIITPSSSKKPSSAIEVIDDASPKITINVRAKDKTFPVKISTTDKFSKVAKYIAKQLNVDVSKVKLMFDGMALNVNETPADQDMEDDDIIDCQVKAK
ncbi:hypothetical protein C9374_013230 [Naegleria lovaniensis]|uniref:Ubiquitin-like domain-containing protein n=1 Tax=Naegleria lovaniensis TaxID=51637 RepID=A0AA88GVG9_NAELO|nr:uncharacterized protein C9374_013230 [Naegleria lovaniensis]KAG2391745.1 hypothetical protein C9374_013230 [Naegleria lovaniensis]